MVFIGSIKDVQKGRHFQGIIILDNIFTEYILCIRHHSKFKILYST